MSDFIWPFLPPYMVVIPNSKMAFIFPISGILVPIFMIYFAKCESKGSFPKSQIKTLYNEIKDGEPTKKKKKKKKKTKKNNNFFREFFVWDWENHTFWHLKWGKISAPKSRDREPWLLTQTLLTFFM